MGRACASTNTVQSHGLCDAIVRASRDADILLTDSSEAIVDAVLHKRGWCVAGEYEVSRVEDSMVCTENSVIRFVVQDDSLTVYLHLTSFLKSPESALLIMLACCMSSNVHMERGVGWVHPDMRAVTTQLSFSPSFSPAAKA